MSVGKSQIDLDLFVEPLWTRQKQLKEPPKEYAMFMEYLHLHPLVRGLTALMRAQNGDRVGMERVSVPGRWRTWCWRWRWVKRASAYDVEVYGQRMIEHEAEMERVNREHQEIGAAFCKKAAEGIALLQLATVETIDEQGQKVRILKSNVTATELISMLRVGTELERLAIGMVDKYRLEEYFLDQLAKRADSSDSSDEAPIMPNTDPGDERSDDEWANTE